MADGLGGIYRFGPAMSSVILAACQPPRFTVADSRALKTLRRLVLMPPGPVRFRLDDWLPYLTACRKLARTCGLTLRQVNRALWVGASDPLPPGAASAEATCQQCRLGASLILYSRLPGLCCQPGTYASRVSDAFQRWQDNSRRSLEFVNNVLIALGSGLIAVGLDGADDPAKLAHLLPWQRAASGTAVILLGLSVLAGLATAANRLQSTRLTARQIRLRNLRDKAFPIGDSGGGWQYRRLSNNIQSLTTLEHITRARLRNAARHASHTAPTRDDVNQVVEELRRWISKADNRTWWLIRAQLWLFVVGGAVFSSVPAWNYFRGI